MKRIIIAIMLMAGVARGEVAFESATMTDSNAPSPAFVTSDSEYSAAYAAWQAFKRDAAATYWNTALDSNPHYATYDCGSGNSNICNSVLLNSQASYNIATFMLQGSQDNANWTTIISTSSVSSLVSQFLTSNTDYYRYFKTTALTCGGAFYAVNEIELSSADFVGAVMTANNAPSPYVVSADVEDGAYGAYKAFNRVQGLTASWSTGTGTNFPHWLKLDYGSNVVINGFVNQSYPNYGISNYVLSASTDDVTYSTINTGVLLNLQSAQLKTNSNTTAYRYWKITATDGYDAGQAVVIEELTFKHYPVASTPAPPPTPRPFLLKTKDNKMIFRVKK